MQFPRKKHAFQCLQRPRASDINMHSGVRVGRGTKGACGKLKSVCLFKVIQAENNFLKALLTKRTKVCGQIVVIPCIMCKEHNVGCLGGGAWVQLAVRKNAREKGHLEVGVKDLKTLVFIL